MACTACGDAPKKDQNFTKAVLEIDNPEQLVLFRKVVIPASMGDDETVPPSIGKYRNVLLHYDANNHNYLYSTDGVPTLLSAEVPQEVLDRISNLETGLETEIEMRESDVTDLTADIEAEATARALGDASLEESLVEEAGVRANADAALNERVDSLSSSLSAETTAREAADTRIETTVSGLADALTNETTARTTADTNLQSQIDAISASSDVTDIVGTHAELDSYDTSALRDKDIIKVLQDETHNDETTYYRWSTVTNSFTLIGEEGPYYTRAQADELLNDKADKSTTYTKTEVDAELADKQDTLTAGEAISIVDNVISATNTGLARELTEADYNYPASNPDRVALWLLEPGMYKWGLDVKVKAGISDSESYDNGGAALIGRRILIPTSGYYDAHIIILSTNISGAQARAVKVSQNGVVRDSGLIGSPVNSLTSTSYRLPLAASQGKVLDDKIGGDLSNLTTTDKTSLIAAINELVGSSGGGIVELTSSDYDYPTSNPTSVALWRLPTGIYSSKSGVAVSPTIDHSTSYGGVFLVGQVSSNLGDNAVVIGMNGGTGSLNTKIAYDYSYADGQPWPGYSGISALMSNQVVDNLTSISPANALSANQGRILKGLIDDINNAGYQTASDVSTSIANAVADITSFEYQVVTELPASGAKGTIYLLPNSGESPNIYDEYLWVNNAWEKIGTTEIDLSGYPTTEVMDTALAKKANTADLAKVATSGSYSDLTNKPTIPTVNNATLTIQKNGSSVGTFTANSSTNTTVNITVPNAINNLTTTTTGNALDAAQGKALKDLIDSNAVTNFTDAEWSALWS